ncbi:MAG: hypothetical protein SF028_14345 [Candidatus Sumerlaeia bacterium]|nr:hypothetical protein [Candidatus Sumerlaeia bacterium]
MHRGTPAALAAATLALASAASAQVTNLLPGYTATEVALPEPPTGSVAADPRRSDSFYVSAGFFGDTRIYRLTFGPGSATSARLVANGVEPLAPGRFLPRMDNVLDSGFGSVWFTSNRLGDLLVVDNDLGLGGASSGEGVFLLRDYNRDGDFLDIVNRRPEASRVIGDPIATTGGNFTGSGIAVGASSWLVPTSDGPGAGEVLSVFIGGGKGQRVYYSPLDFASGIVADPQGRVLVGNTDGTFAAGSITYLTDANGDGDALDPGESQVVPTPPIYDLAQTGAGATYRLAASTNGFPPAVQFVNADGSLTKLADLSVFATGIAFDSSTRSFQPGSGPNGKRLLLTDLNSSTFAGQLHVITPSAP